MRAEYALEKLRLAIEGMAVSPRPLQLRLESAHLTFHPIREDDFPSDGMKAIYRDLMDRLTAVKDPSRGYVPATVAQLSDDEAEEIARMIVNLCDALEAHLS